MENLLVINCIQLKKKKKKKKYLITKTFLLIKLNSINTQINENAKNSSPVLDIPFNH